MVKHSGISSYTGLAYVDVKKLKRSEMVIGVDGKEWRSTCSKKRTLHPALFFCVSLYSFCVNGKVFNFLDLYHR